MQQLTAELAAEIAALIAPSLHRPYPNKIAHLLHDDGDARPPRALTPLFFGCFDWHSAVHSHWSLVRLCRLVPTAPWRPAVRAALDESFTAERAAGEVAYLRAPGREGFEMPYGVAWLLALAQELRRDTAFSTWHAALAPLEALAVTRMTLWLTRLPLPIRTGEHNQSAFGMALALDYARSTGATELERVVVERALHFYRGDRDAPLAYEPSAHDFLSPALAEADLMRRVLPAATFESWWCTFAPGLAQALAPVQPVDRADGKLCHFDGLNLSRAWMLRDVAAALPAGGERRHLALLAQMHLEAGLHGLRSGHYAGAHWLGSFALYALTPAEP